MRELVSTSGGKVVKEDNWGKKKLAYRIKKNRKAHFTMFNLDAPAAARGDEDFVVYGWPYTLGDIVSSLAGVGLRIDLLHEFPFSESPHGDFLVQARDGTWRLPADLGHSLFGARELAAMVAASFSTSAAQSPDRSPYHQPHRLLPRQRQG